MAKTFIALAKTGDILNALPIVHHEFVTTGKKPTLIVARQYSSILERVKYVEPCVFPGDWQDLAGALKMAKQKFCNVACLSTHGRAFAIEHRTSSFVLDQYERANLLPLYDTLPLVISHKPREPFKQPTILYADHSESSPFLAKQELYSLLVESFPSHQIIRLSDIRLPHVVDFVGYYDQADALVTIETMHLHLSAATKTPTFALATDRPSRWNGSAPSKRFAWYARYSEFESRKGELVQSIKDTLSGMPKPEIVVLN